MAQTAIDETRDDGGAAKVGAELLTGLKTEIDLIVRQGDDGLWDSRVDSQNARYCIWDGQSADGRKHADDRDDEPPMPFEGACDQRIRLADMLVNEDVMLVVLATLRARMTIKPLESSDRTYAGKMQMLLNWILHNQMGFSYVRELIKLANYVMADTPAVAMMGVVWRRETALKLTTITVDELAQLYVEALVSALQPAEPETMAAAQAAMGEFQAALLDEAYGTDELAGTLMQFFPHLRPGRAKKVIGELRKNGEAEFPTPYTRRDGVEMNAKRLWEDWFVPSNTTDFQRCRCYFEREFLTAVEVRERQISEGWSQAFADQVLGVEGQGGHEGEVIFKEYERNKDGVLQERDKDSYRGLYEILTAYFLATNEDGIPGRYYVTMHYQVDVPAHEKRLLDYAHGNYAGHAFQREVLTSRLLDARGIPELASSDQDIVKLLQDGYGDNAQLGAVPPVITRGRKSMGALYIAPLAELQAKRDGDYKWMQPPAFPATVVKMLETKRRDINEYFGRGAVDVDPQLVEMHRQYKALWWLANMAEVYRQVLQLAQQWMPDETLQRITNQAGEPMIRSREEIQGQFDISIQFDPRYMNVEFIKELGGVLKDILLAMDRDQTILTAPVVSALMWWIAPELAQESLRSVDQANISEMEDEMKAYQQIRAGVEPPMAEDGGQNYALRLGMYRQMEEANPAIYSDMSPDKVEILKARLQHLQVMSEQFGENRQIGRQGAKRAPGAGGELGGGGEGRQGQQEGE
jgi:hypothetical protein